MDILVLFILYGWPSQDSHPECSSITCCRNVNTNVLALLVFPGANNNERDTSVEIFCAVLLSSDGCSESRLTHSVKIKRP